MSRTKTWLLWLLAAGLTIYGWSNTYVTLSSDMPQAYRPFVLTAFLCLGSAQVVLIAIAVKMTGAHRHLALGAVMLNCFALFNNSIHASYVLFSS